MAFSNYTINNFSLLLFLFSVFWFLWMRIVFCGSFLFWLSSRLSPSLPPSFPLLVVLKTRAFSAAYIFWLPFHISFFNEIIVFFLIRIMKILKNNNNEKKKVMNDNVKIH